MTYGLSPATIQKIGEVLKRHPQVTQAVLYGSRAKGTYRNGSDIDLTLCGGADLTEAVLARIAWELDDLFLPYTIDLSLFASLSNRDLIEHIQRVGVTFYAKGEAIPETA